jgi:two-component system OmpR family response regulator
VNLSHRGQALAARAGAHPKLTQFSPTAFTAVCCDDVMTPDDATLLVVEDEPFLQKAVVASLRFLGFQVTGAENGTDALRAARNLPFDLLIVDVMLPDIDGFEIVRRLRADRNHVPVIFLTAKDSREDKLTGLTIGGDDYLTKPFELEELAARVRTVLRRTRPAAPEPVLSFADLTLDQDTYEVRRGGRLIRLSPTEFRLLRYFMLNPGRVLTRTQLLSHVWDYDFGGASTVVSTYVTYLRRKLASDGPDLIHTQRAVGFSLRLPRPDDEPGPGEVRTGQVSTDQCPRDQRQGKEGESG